MLAKWWECHFRKSFRELRYYLRCFDDQKAETTFYLALAIEKRLLECVWHLSRLIRIEDRDSAKRIEARDEAFGNFYSTIRTASQKYNESAREKERNGPRPRVTRTAGGIRGVVHGSGLPAYYASNAVQRQRERPDSVRLRTVVNSRRCFLFPVYSKKLALVQPHSFSISSRCYPH